MNELLDAGAARNAALAHRTTTTPGKPRTRIGRQEPQFAATRSTRARSHPGDGRIRSATRRQTKVGNK
jgi:hypothetical protein